jgi:TetR/AcrR family transcriptional regulator, mexJK operon transcriptional repressor
MPPPMLKAVAPPGPVFPDTKGDGENPPALGRKYEAVINAATALFIKGGYAATSMAEIAHGAHVSKATLYAYFKNKEALFQAIIQRRCAKQLALLEAAQATQRPVRETLVQLAWQIIDNLLSEESLALYRLVIAEAQRQPALAKVFYTTGPLAHRQRLAAYLAEASAQGKLSIEDPLLAAQHFIALVMGPLQLERILGLDDGIAFRQGGDENDPRPLTAPAQKITALSVALFLGYYQSDLSAQRAALQATV